MFSWCPISPIFPTVFPPTLPWGSLSWQGAGTWPDGDLQFRPSLCIMSNCWLCTWSHSAAGGSLCDDDWARHQSEYSRISVKIISLNSFASSVWFYHRSLGYLVWGSWPSSLGWAWAHCDVGLKLNKTLIGHSKFSATIAPSTSRRQDRLLVKGFVAELLSRFVFY